MQKKYLYIIGIAVMTVWVAFRIFMIASESARVVYNSFRENAKHGTPVEALRVYKKTDVLKQPLYIKNNKADVSCMRINKFKVGQAVGAGRIVSVSAKIDLDSGMCTVRTSGVTSGETFAHAQYTGYFIPVHAITDGHVMLDVDGVATSFGVKKIAEDSEYTLVSGGLSDGDVVILSSVEEGEKVRWE